MTTVKASSTKDRSETAKTRRERTGVPKSITEEEAKDVEELSSPRTPVIYEIVRRLGEEEMDRPVISLWWSGVAGGLSISFSLLTQAILETRLPDASWRALVVGFGYSVGFLMVVMARQQLFTESTITVVLPVMANLSWDNIVRMARLWVVVLIANLVGTLFAALFCNYTPVISPDLLRSMLSISHQLTEPSWPEMFFRAISAGFLIAAMVWLIPGSEGTQFHIVTLMTYLIAIGGFAHVVAGSMEAYLLVLNGEWSALTMITNFMIPVLLGNIVGGTALFALISYAQVMQEI
jgi:formate/nitrite transporter FocA (FNT family)